MCSPLAAGAALLTVAGTAAQYVGQQQANNAQENVAKQNVAKNAALSDQAQQQFNISNQLAQKANIDADAAKRTTEHAAALVPPPPTDADTYQPGQQDNSSSSVKNAIVGQRAGANQALTTEGNARAKLDGINDAFRDLASNTQPQADRINQVGTAIQAQNSLLPLEMTVAGRTGGGLRSIGSIMTGLGSVASAGAGSLAAAGAGAAGETALSSWGNLKNYLGGYGTPSTVVANANAGAGAP